MNKQGIMFGTNIEHLKLEQLKRIADALEVIAQKINNEQSNSSEQN